MIALILCAIASPLIRSEHVDMIELNHVYGQCGTKTFSQIIFWEVDPATRRLNVRAWKMCQDEDDVPRRNETTGFIEARHSKAIIRSRMYRESHSHVDPERENLKVHPDNERIMVEGLK